MNSQMLQVLAFIPKPHRIYEHFSGIPKWEGGIKFVILLGFFGGKL